MSLLKRIKNLWKLSEHKVIRNELVKDGEVKKPEKKMATIINEEEFFPDDSAN